MKLHHTSTVQASPAEVWKFLQDTRAVVACLPGAELTDELEDDKYGGVLRVAIGPLKMNYNGQVDVTRRDAESRELAFAASGRDRRGGGSVRADVRVEVIDAGGGGAVMGGGGVGGGGVSVAGEGPGRAPGTTLAQASAPSTQTAPGEDRPPSRRWLARSSWSPTTTSASWGERKWRSRLIRSSSASLIEESASISSIARRPRLVISPSIPMRSGKTAGSSSDPGRT